MGGKEVKEPSIFLHGQIRAGRSNNTKRKLISNLRDILVKKSKLDETQVWVYIVDIAPSQMIEYGASFTRVRKRKRVVFKFIYKIKKKTFENREIKKTPRTFIPGV